MAYASVYDQRGAVPGALAGFRRLPTPRAQTFVRPRQTAGPFTAGVPVEEAGTPTSVGPAGVPDWARNRLPDWARNPVPRPAVPRGTPAPGDPQGYLSVYGGGGFNNLQDLVRYLIQSGGMEGAFQPDYLRRVMRERALRNAAGQRTRGGLLAQLAGLDPSQQRAALLESDISASGGLTEALNQADLAGAGSYMDFIRSLLASERGGESSSFENAAQRRFEQSQRGGLGDFLGQAVGIGAGSFLGGYGSERGRRAGR